MSLKIDEMVVGVASAVLASLIYGVYKARKREKAVTFDKDSLVKAAMASVKYMPKIQINGNEEADFMSDFAGCTKDQALDYIYTMQEYEKKLGLCDGSEESDIITEYDDQIEWEIKHTGLTKDLCKKLFDAQTAWFLKNGIISMEHPEYVNAYRRVWE